MIMKKIILAALFTFLGLNMQAQQLIPLQDIRTKPNEIVNYTDVEVTALKKQLNLTDTQAKELKPLLYNKFKNLTAELSSDEILGLAEGIQERLKVVLGATKYSTLAQNTQLLHIITGLAYLKQ